MTTDISTFAVMIGTLLLGTLFAVVLSLPDRLRVHWIIRWLMMLFLGPYFLIGALEITTLGIQLVATLIGILCIMPFPNRRKLYKWVPWTGLIVSLGWFSLLCSREVEQIRQTLARYPLVDLSPRLTGLIHSPSNQTLRGAENNSVVLAEDVEKQLAFRESRVAGDVREPQIWRLGRPEVLQKLHEGISLGFVMAQGQGMYRLPKMWGKIEQLELPPETSIPQLVSTLDDPDPGTNVEEISPAGNRLQALKQTLAPPLKEHEFQTLHDNGAVDFLDRNRFGYVAPNGKAAGFVSHRFSAFPTTTLFESAGDYWPSEKGRWGYGRRDEPSSLVVDRIELISLLKHSPPVAYVTSTLPNMDELANVPTRPLDPFETQSLQQLQTEEDITIDDRGHYIRMVGSLRASSDCLKCHDVPRGTLLGAFSYRLRATSPAPPNPKLKSPL